MRLPIYLDYSATTPVDPRVAQKMIPYLTEHFGNPASRSHAFGWQTEAAVEEARNEVAALVNCDAKELVWTSGATESGFSVIQSRTVTVPVSAPAAAIRTRSRSVRMPTGRFSSTTTTEPTRCSRIRDAASAGTDAVIPGVPSDEAARLRDRLASRCEAQLAGL